MAHTQDVEIEGRDLEGNFVKRKFRIGLMRADIGSWCLSIFISKQMADESNYIKAQGYGFDVCYLIKEQANNTPIKIYEMGGRGWLIPDLAYDAGTAYVLWDKVLEFNFGPFFQRADEERKRKLLAEASTNGNSDTVQPLSPAISTTISGGL
jgi:hypothetical protein